MTAQPDLLDILAEHEHTPGGCDFHAGFVTAMRRAAAYVQDYGHDVPDPVLVRMQAPMLRAVEIAQCEVCNPHGCVVDDQGRHVDHHPLERKP